MSRRWRGVSRVALGGDVGDGSRTGGVFPDSEGVPSSVYWSEPALTSCSGEVATAGDDDRSAAETEGCGLVVEDTNGLLGGFLGDAFATRWRRRSVLEGSSASGATAPTLAGAAPDGGTSNGFGGRITRPVALDCAAATPTPPSAIAASLTGARAAEGWVVACTAAARAFLGGPGLGCGGSAKSRNGLRRGGMAPVSCSAGHPDLFPRTSPAWGHVGAPICHVLCDHLCRILFAWGFSGG